MILKDVISEFLQKIKNTSPIEGNNSYNVISINIPNLKFLNLFKEIDLYPKCYFSQKNSDRRVLGIGVSKFFSNHKELEEIDKIVKRYPQAIIMGGQSFFDNDTNSNDEWAELSGKYYFLPRLLVTHFNKLTNISLFYQSDSVDLEKTLTFLNNLLIKKTIQTQTGFTKTASPNSDYNHFEQYTQKAVEGINDKQFNKVVIARKLVKDCSNKKSIENIINSWDEKESLHYHFILQTNEGHAFLSVTPERLFKIEEDFILVDSIAGTRARSNDRIQDKVLEDDLINDKKEIEEHEYVSSSIKRSLKIHGQEVFQTKNKEVLKLKNVQHIFSQYRAKLNNKTSFIQILKGLHPTPAVGGYPKRDAINFIKKNEKFKRGLYAAPIGIISKDHTEFAVGIRSVLIQENKAHIFAGCGIVKGSIAQKEWEETFNKMKNFTVLI